jgi:hypothetical protein
MTMGGQLDGRDVFVCGSHDHAVRNWDRTTERVGDH